MRFDYTKGCTPNYMVSICTDTIDDFYYFHYFKEAKKLFESAKAKSSRPARISLWDMKRDVKKAFAAVEGGAI